MVLYLQHFNGLNKKKKSLEIADIHQMSPNWNEQL